MATSGVPAPLVPNSDANKVEIDLTRQVLFLYEGGSLSKILPVSSGTAETPTPTGSYRVYRQATGWETSALGRLYNSQYFVGGYAIHGSLSVPNYPASHGCVRLPMSAAEWFPDHVGHRHAGLRPRRLARRRPTRLQVVDHPGDALHRPPARGRGRR